MHTARAVVTLAWTKSGRRVIVWEMTDDVTDSPTRRVDAAWMLAELEERHGRSTVAKALRVKESELELIAVGRIPKQDVADRLESLYELSQKTTGDFTPWELVQTMSQSLRKTGLTGLPLPRLRTIVAFLALDLVVAAAIWLLLAARA